MREAFEAADQAATIVTSTRARTTRPRRLRPRSRRARCGLRRRERGGSGRLEARCLSQAYNAAEAAVVAEYYAQGKLGSSESVHDALDQPGMQFFDEQDRMLPYEELSPDEQSVLVLWFNHDRVGRITESAREEAVEQADPDC